MLLMASSSRCKLMLTIFPCALQVHFFILPWRKQRLNGMIRVSVKTGHKKLGSLEILSSVSFFTFLFHTHFMTRYSFCDSSGVTMLLSCVWEGSSGAELQLAWWPSIVALQLKKRNSRTKCKWALL